MQTARRVFRNTLVLFGADLSRILFSLFVTAAVARQLGSARLGELSYMLVLVGILAVIADAGMSQFYVRAAQHDPSGGTLGATLALRLVMSTAAAAGLALYAAIGPASLRPLLLLGSAMLWTSALPSWVTAYLRAREQMEVEGIVRVAGSAVTAAGVLGVLWGGGSVTAVAAVIAVTSMLTGLLLLGIGLPRMPRPIPLRQGKAEYRRILVEAWPFAALAVLGTLYFRIDSVMLFAIRGQAALGQYSAAYRVMEAALLLPWVVSASALPPVARYLSTRTAEVLQASRRVLHFLFIVSVPAAALGATLAPALFELLYGPQFAEAAGIFRILAFTLVAVFASSVTSTLISAGPRPTVNTGIALIMLVENVGLNLMVIPRWSGAGAAAATLVTESTGLVLGALYLQRVMPPLRLLALAGKPAIAAGTAAAAALWYPSLAVLPVAVVVYLSVMWLSRGITADDVTFLQALLNRVHPALRPGDA